MQRRIAGLDGLRGLAALAVVFCHCVAGTSQIGGVAVDVFFALSGFLLVKVLHDGRLRIERGDRSFRVQLREFWGRRVARIVPCYAVVATLTLSVLVATRQISWEGVLAFATYTQNFYLAVQGHFMPFGHTWTLAVEHQFYLLFAPLLLFAAARWHRGLLLLLWVGLLGVVLGLLLGGMNAFQVFMSPLTGFSLAAAGGLFAVESTDRRLRAMTRPALAGPGFLVVVALAFIPSAFSDSHVRFNVVQTILLVVLVPTIVAFVAEHPRSLATRLLENKVLKFYGAISYSLYLIHGSLIEWIKPMWPVAPGPRMLAFPLTRLSLFVTMLTLSTVLATASYNLLERRVLQRGPIQFKRGAAPLPVSP